MEASFGYKKENNKIDRRMSIHDRKNDKIIPSYTICKHNINFDRKSLIFVLYDKMT